MAVMTSRRRITRLRDESGASEVGDDLTVEAPLNLIIGDDLIATLMRTPGHDLELAAGWLAVESGVRSSSDLIGLRQCRTDDDLTLRVVDGISGRGVDQVHLMLSEGVSPPRPRAWVTGAACGVCSADVLDLSPLRRFAPHSSDFSVPAAVLQSLPDSLREQQKTFSRTGSLHGVGLASPMSRLREDSVTAGEFLVVREDVGRHNAVDKVNGWAVLHDRVPLTDVLLVVSGRVSFEIVQKAVATGLAGIVAVSAPSDLAVDLAREYDLLLAGMVRPGRMNLYSGVERVTGLDALVH